MKVKTTLKAEEAMRPKLARLFIFWAFLLLATVAAPQTATYGQLVGTVRDAQGQVLPGATVTLYGAGVMGERPVASDLDGSYRFRALSPGTYHLRFEISGFATLNRRGIIIMTGKTITVDAQLEFWVAWSAAGGQED